MTRLTSLQREQIAALKAFGYTNWQIGWHYMKFVLLDHDGRRRRSARWAACGSRTTSRRCFFASISIRSWFSACGRTSWRTRCWSPAARRSPGRSARSRWRSRLPPAEAMRPEPPARYRPTILERIGLGRLVPNVARMVLRQLERHPVKTSFSLLAISMSVAIVVVGNFMAQLGRPGDRDEVLRRAAVRPVAGDGRAAVDRRRQRAGQSCRACTRCEPRRTVPVRLRSRNRARRLGIVGLPPRCRPDAAQESHGRNRRAAAGGLGDLARSWPTCWACGPARRCVSKCCRTSGRSSTCR